LISEKLVIPKTEYEIGAYLERGPGFGDGLLDEVVRDSPGGVLVEDGVHERDLGGTAARLRFGGAALERAEARPPGEGDEAHVRRAAGRHGLVDDEGAGAGVAQLPDGAARRPGHAVHPRARALATARQLHLPELLQRLNHVHCEQGNQGVTTHPIRLISI